MRWTVLLLALPLAAQNALDVDLSGPWRVHGGDDPAFARPDFDDSQWRTVDLPLATRGPSGSFQEIPGIVASGDRTGFWLRRRVLLPAGTDPTRLAISIGAIKDGVEVWVNGRRIGGTGPFRVPEHAPLPQPFTFDIPEAAITPGEVQWIALRVWRGLFVHRRWRLEDQGPYALSYRGRAATAAAREQLRERIVQNLPGVGFAAVTLSIAVISALAWWSDRSRWDLLWFTLLALTGGGSIVLLVATLRPESRPFDHWGGSTFEALLSGLSVVAQGEFTMAILSLGRRWWWRAVLWAGFGLVMSVPFPPSGTARFYWGQMICGGATMAMVLVDWRSKRTQRIHWETWLVRLTILLLALATVENFAIRLLRVPNVVPTAFPVAGFSVDRQDLLWTLLSAIILAMLLRRQAADRREQQRLAGELEAARLVQQLLFAPESGATGAAAVDAVYEPAQEVGGDFYWKRVEPDGSVILAVGDVSGKGLKAAMLVSVAIGILRTERSASPAAILRTMNEGLAGHTGGGFVTCCCARFDPDGAVTLANAGHPSPYCDGREWEVEAGLPLGIAAGAEYGESVARGAWFTFVSDGVVEAENAKRELFGFERTREVSGRSAQEIADAAKAWGQNDDITVVTVRRNA